MLRYDSISPRLCVPELTATVKYYLDVFGFMDWSGWPEDAPTFAIVSRDGATIQFQQVDSYLPVSETTMLHVTVADTDAVLAQIAGRTKIEWGPENYGYGRREFAVRDCNGVMVIFSEETSEAPTCPIDD